MARRRKRRSRNTGGRFRAFELFIAISLLAFLSGLILPTALDNNRASWRFALGLVLVVWVIGLVVLKVCFRAISRARRHSLTTWQSAPPARASRADADNNTPKNTPSLGTGA